ncbi:hypothetical protein NSTC745_00667 [Nostoc sp. DSM 114161]|jgi:antitoxin ParD1/3/4
MLNVEKISVALTAEMAAFVRDVVESGEYTSSSEVIREALQDWKQKRLLQLQNIDEVRHLWQEGIDSGAGQYTDIEAIKQEARRRLGQSQCISLKKMNLTQLLKQNLGNFIQYIGVLNLTTKLLNKYVVLENLW